MADAAPMPMQSEKPEFDIWNLNETDCPQSEM
jgi:hypothetical protein